MNLTNEQLLKEYLDNYKSGAVVTIPVIWLEQLSLDTLQAGNALNCDARMVRAQILKQLREDRLGDRRPVLPPVRHLGDLIEIRKASAKLQQIKMSNLCQEIFLGPTQECVLGTIVCWSCNQRVTPESVADNDGFCPKCQAEHTNEDDED